jgi:hypothetical protein
VANSSSPPSRAINSHAARSARVFDFVYAVSPPAFGSVQSSSLNGRPSGGLPYHLGKRTAKSTDAFIGKLAYATSEDRFQLTTDGFGPYLSAVKMVLRDRVDFAQLIKVYGTPRDGEQRYSPAEVVDSVPVEIMGRPVADRICTSHIERQNLSVRMGTRRMTRLTNGFSKKWENLEFAYALWFAYYNFVRVHKSLRVTPAMEAGITDHIWTIAELIA